MTQRLGETIQNWTDEATLHDETPIKDKKVPVLFIEGDGLMLKGAKEKRPELKNPLMFESTESSGKAFERAGKWLEKEYDLRDTIVILNSDGGTGYERDKLDAIIGK